MIDLENLTIEKAHAAFMAGEYSSEQLTRAYLENIENKNPELNMFREVFFDSAIADAKRADARIKENKNVTMLTGIPFAFKDNILIEGHKASACSKMLENYTATYDATVTKLLKEAGIVILGRTNMDDSAMGSSTETSPYGRTMNPNNPEYVPGGSSGGSAAAVAADCALVALGSDTGGSIRQPAAFCNVVGMMPTYGTVSRGGLIAMASSLDVIGPITKNTRDAEIVYSFLNKFDALDSTSYSETMRASLLIDSRISPEGENDLTVAEESINKTRAKMRIGIPREFLNGDGIDTEVLKNFNESIEKLKFAGHEIVDVSLPLMKYSLAVYYVVQPAEVSSNLSRLDGIRYGAQEKGDTLLEVYKNSRGKNFGKEVRRRIMLGTYVLSHGYFDAYYNKATKLRIAIRKEFEKVFESVDVIATPTSPFPPFKAGEKSANPVAMYLSDLFTVPANIASIPAISIPSGKTENGLPLGLHFFAPQFGEEKLFAASKEFETVRE